MKHAKGKAGRSLSRPRPEDRSRWTPPEQREGNSKAPDWGGSPAGNRRSRTPVRGGLGERAMNVIPVLVLLLVAGAVAVTLFRGMTGELWYENNATIGKIEDGSEQLQKMQEMVDKGMITMSINAYPVWELSQKEAGVNWLIENPEEQANKLIRVEIYLDETGEKLYETGAIRPGTYVTGTRPERDLAAGQYICTAYFHSYDIETKEYLGKAAAQIVLTVRS